MGHQNNVATCVEELGSTKTYRRSECAPKRTRIPNLVTAKSELSVAVNLCIGGRGPPFLQYMPKSSSWITKQYCNVRRRIEIHQNMQEEQTRLKRAKVPNLAQAATSQLLVAVRCEGEGMVHHSFNICPKALHGS